MSINPNSISNEDNLWINPTVSPIPDKVTTSEDQIVDSSSLSQPSPEIKVTEQAKRINSAAFGLKGIKETEKLDLSNLIRTPDERIDTTQTKEGTIIKSESGEDRYIFKGEKKFGVEPGFQATKAWTKVDDKKLYNPNHKFHKQALEYIEEQVKSDPYDTFDQQMKELKDNPKSLLDVVSREYPIIFRKMKEHIMANQPKFQKIHYIKLDYSLPGADGKVRIPFFRTRTRHIFGKKTPQIISKLGRHLHRSTTADTPQEKNFGAVVEALSNDILRVLDKSSNPNDKVEGQKLKIIKTTYSDGKTVKLLLDGTHIEGPGGEKFSTLEGQIKQGWLEGNQVKVTTKDGKVEKYPLNEHELGPGKVKALFLGDRDKVGSGGANVGFVVVNGTARLLNIDPGKSLELIENTRPERRQYNSTAAYLLSRVLYDIKFFFTGKTDRLRHYNLRSDLSFEQPTASIKDIISKGYKNFTIFDDTKLSDKMAGMKKILNEWGTINNLFKEYVEAFSEGELNFKDKLIELQKKLAERKDAFEKVLGERLKLNDNELNLLDNFEKLTSETINHVRRKNEIVEFKHLQVVPQGRKEWHLEEKRRGSNMYTLRYNPSSPEDAKQVLQQIRDYYERYQSKTGDTRPLDAKIDDQHQVVVEFPKTEANRMFYIFNEQTIAFFKGQPLRNIPNPVKV